MIYGHLEHHCLLVSLHLTFELHNPFLNLCFSQCDFWFQHFFAQISFSFVWNRTWNLSIPTQNPLHLIWFRQWCWKHNMLLGYLSFVGHYLMWFLLFHTLYIHLNYTFENHYWFYVLSWPSSPYLMWLCRVDNWKLLP